MKIETDIDWKLFDKIIEAMNLEEMDMFQVCKHIYEATYRNRRAPKRSCRT